MVCSNAVSRQYALCFARCPLWRGASSHAYLRLPNACHQLPCFAFAPWRSCWRTPFSGCCYCLRRHLGAPSGAADNSPAGLDEPFSGHAINVLRPVYTCRPRFAFLRHLRFSLGGLARVACACYVLISNRIQPSPVHISAYAPASAGVSPLQRDGSWFGCKVGGRVFITFGDRNGACGLRGVVTWR